jgi:hypothetical protein
MYTITASGLINGPGFGDADGYALYPQGWANIAQTDGAAVGQGELLINYARVAWGAFQPDHIYTTTEFVDAGETLGFNYADSYPFVDPRYGQVMNWYGDNTGSFNVSIQPAVPEWPSLALVILSGVGMALRRRKHV